MDPYVVLGVRPDAAPDEIDAAYARRVRLHDPDPQDPEDGRGAPRRSRSELGDASRALLGAAPRSAAPAATGDGPAGPATTSGGAPGASAARRPRETSAGR